MGVWENGRMGESAAAETSNVQRNEVWGPHRQMLTPSYIKTALDSFILCRYTGS